MNRETTVSYWRSTMPTGKLGITALTTDTPFHSY